MRRESGKEIFFVTDTEELENLDASEIDARTQKNGLNFMFLIADGTVKLSADQHERGEERQDDLRGESDGSQPTDTMINDRSPKRFVVNRRGLHLSSSR